MSYIKADDVLPQNIIKIIQQVLFFYFFLQALINAFTYIVGVFLKMLGRNLKIISKFLKIIYMKKAPLI